MAVYSFTTTVYAPLTGEFDCFDVKSASMKNIFLFSEVSQNRGAPWISHDVNNDLNIMSDDGVASWVDVDLPISDNFTVEAKFKPAVLPANFDDLTSQLMFIGAYDKQGNGGGIAISRAGIAIVGVIPAFATALPGSQNLFTEGEVYHTIRIAVNGDTDTMNVYVTRSADLPSTGHQLRYTSAAPPTPVTEVDRVLLKVIGQPGNAVTAKFDTLKCNCTTALVPNQRPIADPGADQSGAIGGTVIHDGRASYDPEGLAITYDWRLTDAPDGSRFKLSGQDGETSDDGDSDGYTKTFRTSGLTTFSATDAPLLQPGDHLVIEGIVYQVSSDRWDLVSGRYMRGATWVDNEVVVTTDTLPDSMSGQNWKLLHSNSYYSDQQNSHPSGIPDKAGLYTVELVVNDGQLDSLPAEALLNVGSTSVPLGCIPDVGFIWNHLSDFWNLLEDKEVAETVWSGFAQAAAAQLLTAWQIDYNKSLIDIQRVFQRRWLSYSTLLEDPSDSIEIRIIRGPIFTGDLTGGKLLDGKTLQVVLDAGDVQTIEFEAGTTGIAPALTADEIAHQINTELGLQGTGFATVVSVGGDEYVKLSYPTLLRIRPQGTANVDLGFSDTDYQQNDLQGTQGKTQTAGGYYSFWANGAPLSPPELDFQDEGINGSDILVKDGLGYRVRRVAVDPLATEQRYLTLDDPLPNDNLTEWFLPSVVVSTDLNFYTELVTAGDLAKFEVKDLTGGTSTVDVYCEIVGVAAERIGFDPKPLLEKYAGETSRYETTFIGVKRINYIPLDELVDGIPRLQEIIKDPPITFDQNMDYIIDTFRDTNALRFNPGTFTLMDPPPDTFWAELTYLDNRPTIEANFGKLVNFTVEQMEEYTSDLDYLSAVQGLWWAYFGGPALYKVRTGIQILLGLPFAEVDSVVESIAEDFSLDEGRIVMRDVSDTNVLRTYYYPRAAGLALNEATGVEIAVGDEIPQFSPLSGGIEVLDYVKTPLWMKKYVNSGAFTELDKFFRFLVRGDVDTFSITNMVFAIDFARKIKPHYTNPLFVLMKNVDPDQIDVVDQLNIKVIADFFDSSCPQEPGAYRWDDTDGGGNFTKSYDDPMPTFGYDTQRLCPAMLVYAIMRELLGTGPWNYDSIWAFDDGDTDGDMVSDDIVPLSGPDTLPPAPYGPLVGIVSYDATKTAGRYTRSKVL